MDHSVANVNTLLFVSNSLSRSSLHIFALLP